MLKELEQLFTNFSLGLFLGIVIGLPLGVALLIWGMNG